MVKGHDAWQLDQPDVQADLARRRSAQTAWHAYNQMERAISALREAMGDPELGPEWRDQLRTVALRAGALAIGQEV